MKYTKSPVSQVMTALQIASLYFRQKELISLNRIEDAAILKDEVSRDIEIYCAFAGVQF